ncbi:MAG: hypothetical protein KDC53_23550, partial [Saprospiraceae bacterium]|nr:hypothetical protein [Saprospiraceae bacterium]
MKNHYYLLLVCMLPSCFIKLQANNNRQVPATDTLPSLLPIHKKINFISLDQLPKKQQSSPGVALNSTSCQDLVQYPTAKATSLSPFSLNNATSALAL